MSAPDSAPDSAPHRAPHQAPDDVVARLRRWEEAGAVWRVVAQGPRWLTVGLFTCDGGEEVERLTSEDPALLCYVADRSSSQE